MADAFSISYAKIETHQESSFLKEEFLCINIDCTYGDRGTRERAYSRNVHVINGERHLPFGGMCLNCINDCTKDEEEHYD